jgi:CubicO group peptidase (beta-lactamase class C family)
MQPKSIPMRILKKSLFIVSIIILLIVVLNYTKLNIIAGYSAKNMSSSVFLANRTLTFTDTTDTNFSPINLAKNTIDPTKKTASSSAFGLLTRTAFYREGLGSVLITDDFDTSLKVKTPKRTTTATTALFPFGNTNQKDTLFSHVNYPNLNATVDHLFNNNTQTRAVVVLHKQQIVAEQYANNFTKDSRLLGWSMTKSILSAVFGILQHQGKLNVQDTAPVLAWQNDDRKNITIHNLLQMNSGLEWDENYSEISDVTKMLFLEKDMSALQAKKQVVSAPNTTWNYSSGTTNLLSGIIRKKFSTHQAYLDYWYSDLIDKIGMNSMVIETDMSGNYVGSSYAWATARDWAKFGLLYLNKGNWNGEQLFDASWVDYTTTVSNDSDGAYGAHFWLNAGGKFPDVPKNMFYAKGYQGQSVFVFPDQDLVVVRMGLEAIDINNFLKKLLKSF